MVACEQVEVFADLLEAWINLLLREGHQRAAFEAWMSAHTRAAYSREHTRVWLAACDSFERLCAEAFIIHAEIHYCSRLQKGN